MIIMLLFFLDTSDSQRIFNVYSDPKESTSEFERELKDLLSHNRRANVKNPKGLKDDRN